MEPAGSHPWSYAYNRIVPSASTSSGEEFQHPHLATITAAAGQSAQSILLQAAHAGFNSANSFVSPSPIASYNPVFSQIYHHAAAASGNVQPKPAHYATNNISATHRQAHISTIEKTDQQNNFQQQNQSPSNVPGYYGENSSSSGASPSPTTSAITSTSLSWNSQAQFIAIQQQQQQLQQQQQQIQQLSEKTKSMNSSNSVVVTSAQGSTTNNQGFVVYKFNNRNNNTSYDSSNTSNCANTLLNNFPSEVVHSSVITRTINTNNSNQQQYNCCQEPEASVTNKQKVDVAKYYAAAAAALVQSEDNNVEPYTMSPNVQVRMQFQNSPQIQQIKQESESEQSVSLQSTPDVRNQTLVATKTENNKKTEDVKPPPPTTTKKTPRKRQPKKTITSENEFSMQSTQNAMQNSQANGENYYEFNRWQINQQQQQQQQQTQQQQQQNVQNQEQKVQNVIQVPSYNTNTNNVNSQPQPSSHPQPAHMQSSVPHSSSQSHLSSYYPAFPQQISSQYAACMSQQTTPSIYNLVPHTNNQTHLANTQQRSSEPSSPSPSNITSNKVIVPNIEEELKFLSETDPKKILASHRANKKVSNNTNSSSSSTTNTNETSNNVYQPCNDKKTTQKCGFMDSYLKFLQGDRDESPSPNNLKTGRKINYKPGNSNVSNQSKRKTGTGTGTQNVVNSNENSIDPDVHKVQILSDKQILPKKRHISNANSQSTSATENLDQLQQHLQQQQQQQQQTQQAQQLAQQSPQTQNTSQTTSITHRPQQYSNINEDFPKREYSKRRSNSRTATGLNQNDDCQDDSGDSDMDPVWTPQNKEDDIIKSELDIKLLESKNVKSNVNNEDYFIKDKSVQPQISSSSLLNLGSSDNFKTGDFIVLRSDLVNDWPTIWQVDSKCILQKYEPYCQNGKMFYRNMSKYASWNLDTKKLYVRAPIRIQIQSHTETIVEFMRTELLADDTEQFIEKIMEEYLSFRDHFEIYIQTMLSQSLDSSFFTEITNENDQYFLNSVRTIDDVMNNCKRKLLSITPWTRSIIMSIETWPQCHVFTDWGQNNVNQKNCGGCHQPGTSVRFLLFGQPYDNLTMQHSTPDPRITYEKDIIFCRICAARADIFHKIAHEKYNLYVTCSHKVAEQQRECPNKNNTEILNDLLAESNWIDELFRNIRNSWAEVESLERQKRFLEVSQ